MTSCTISSGKDRGSAWRAALTSSSLSNHQNQSFQLVYKTTGKMERRRSVRGAGMQSRILVAGWNRAVTYFAYPGCSGSWIFSKIDGILSKFCSSVSAAFLLTWNGEETSEILMKEICHENNLFFSKVCEVGERGSSPALVFTGSTNLQRCRLLVRIADALQLSYFDPATLQSTRVFVKQLVKQEGYMRLLQS
jgi:hypothetical protein